MAFYLLLFFFPCNEYNYLRLSNLGTQMCVLCVCVNELVRARIIISLTKHELSLFILFHRASWFFFAMKDACNCYGVALVCLIHNKAMSILSSLRFSLHIFPFLKSKQRTHNLVSHSTIWNIFIIFHFILRRVFFLRFFWLRVASTEI